MSSFDEVTIYDEKTLAFSFARPAKDSGVRLLIGPDAVEFQMTVPDHAAKSTVARLDLPRELWTKATAKVVFEQAYLAGHLKRDGSASEPTQFPDTPATVRVEQPIWSLGPQRTHAVWARRLTA